MDQSEIPNTFEMGGNMKVYVMPNGKKYRFKDSDVPKDAVLVEAQKKIGPVDEKPVEPKAKETENKAKKPANKSKKAATK